jgi:hypothetical protein
MGTRWKPLYASKRRKITMESRRSQKLLMISFFTAVSLLFIYFIFSLATGTTDKKYHRRLESARTGPGSYHQDMRVNLIREEPVTVNRLELTYRGLSSGKLLLDVVLLDLDPEYVYSRTIAVTDAKKGFRISEHRFKATSVNAKRLRLDLQNQ